MTVRGDDDFEEEEGSGEDETEQELMPQQKIPKNTVPDQIVIEN